MHYRYSKFFQIVMSLPVSGVGLNTTDLTINPVFSTLQFMEKKGLIFRASNGDIEVYNKANITAQNNILPHPVISDLTDLYFMVDLNDLSFADYTGNPATGQFDYTKVNITPAISQWNTDPTQIIFIDEDLTATGTLRLYPLGTVIQAGQNVIQTSRLPIWYPQARIQYVNSSIADLQVVNVKDSKGNIVFTKSYSVIIDSVTSSRTLNYSLDLTSFSTGHYSIELENISGTKIDFILDADFELKGRFALIRLVKDATKMVYNTTAPLPAEVFSVWSFAPG